VKRYGAEFWNLLVVLVAAAVVLGAAFPEVGIGCWGIPGVRSHVLTMAFASVIFQCHSILRFDRTLAGAVSRNQQLLPYSYTGGGRTWALVYRCIVAKPSTVAERRRME